MKKLFKFATVYSLFTTADLKTNMAIRILHSLIPTLVADTATLSEQEDLSGFLARDLIPGAKEAYRYGAAAIAREYTFCDNGKNRSEVKRAISNGDLERGIDLAIQYFNDGFGNTGMLGGDKWITFARVLQKINEQIKKVEKTGSKADAMRLSAYLNALDSLSHNSGSFMEKFVEEEAFNETHEDFNDFGMAASKTLYDLLKMRDITTLEDPEQIIYLIQSNPDIEKRLPKDYQKMIREYRRLHPVNTNTKDMAVSNLKNKQISRETEEQEKRDREWEEASKMYSSHFGGNYS